MLFSWMSALAGRGGALQEAAPPHPVQKDKVENNKLISQLDSVSPRDVEG
jgi:hypothetical protein